MQERFCDEGVGTSPQDTVCAGKDAAKEVTRKVSSAYALHPLDRCMAASHWKCLACGGAFQPFIDEAR